MARKETFRDVLARSIRSNREFVLELERAGRELTDDGEHGLVAQADTLAAELRSRIEQDERRLKEIDDDAEEDSYV